MRDKTLRVLCFNDFFSANLGDRLLGRCLHEALRAELDCKVEGWDIDGKKGPAAEPEVKTWSAKNAVRSLLPRQMTTRINVGRARTRLLSQWRSAANGSPVSAIVVGGGHMLTGTTEYFPARLSAVAEFARDLGVTIHVHSVGVSHPGTWETAAGDELRRFLRDESISSVSVRDEQSADYLVAAGLPQENIRVALDPGLLTARTFKVEKRAPRQRLVIGIGIMSPAVVSAIRTSPSGIGDGFWITVAEHLVASGADISLFTTGEAGDIRMARLVSAELDARGILHDSRAIAPKNDAALVDNIAGFDATVAQRLHASIVSYALGVPSVGLGWDPKVRAFYGLTKRTEYFIDDRDAHPDDAAARVLNAVRNGLDAVLRDQHIEACRDHVRSLATLISKGN